MITNTARITHLTVETTVRCLDRSGGTVSMAQVTSTTTAEMINGVTADPVELIAAEHRDPLANMVRESIKKIYQQWKWRA